jgi:hypothetical protein
MALAHIEDVLYGSDEGSALEIEIPEHLRREIGYERCLLILLVFAYHANQDNLAWPSARTLSTSLGFDVRKVRAGIKVLVHNRLLVRVANQRIGRRGVTYYLNLPSCDPVESRFREVDPNTPQKSAVKVTQAPLYQGTRLGTKSDTDACTKDKEQVNTEDKFDHLSLFSVQFEDFWDCYPNKIERGRAFVCWQTLDLKPGLTFATFFALKRQLDSARGPESANWPAAHIWIESEPWKSLGF